MNGWRTLLNKMKNPEFVYIKPTKRYAIEYSTGTGVVEDLGGVQGFICESDNSRELELFARKIFLTWNSDSDIISSWVGNHFIVKELKKDG